MALPNEFTRRVHVVLSIAAMLFLIKLMFYHYGMIVYPYQLEYREPAMLQTTRNLLDGVNPFSFKNQPQACNAYGIVYNALVAVVSSPASDFQTTHRAVSGLFVLLNALIVLFALRRLSNVSWSFSLAGAALFYAAQLFLVTPLPRPDSMGLFFFLNAMVWPYALGFRRSGLILCGLFSLLAFYTKVYFVLAGGFVTLYMALFQSLRKAVIFGAAFGALMLVSVIVMNALFDAYFYIVVLALNNLATYALDYVLQQLVQFFCVLFVGLTVGVLLVWLNRFVTRGSFASESFRNLEYVDAGLRRLQFKRFDAPLWQSAMPGYWSYCFAVTLLVFVLKLGGHKGNYMVYVIQLSGPFLVIGSLSAFDRYKRGTALFASLVLLTMGSSYFFKGTYKMTTESEAAFEKANSFVAQRRNVLSTPAVGNLLIQHRLPIYDTGNTETFGWAAKSKGLLTAVFPKTNLVTTIDSAYAVRVRGGIANKTYDGVISETSDLWLIRNNELSAFYVPMDTVRFTYAQTFLTFDLIFWVPK